MKKKILVINCSPKGKKGNTKLILDPFVEGMKDAGADLEIIDLRKLKIKDCTGCLGCLSDSCIMHDDMDILLPKMTQADLWVFSGGIYMNALPVKTTRLLERLHPILDWEIEFRDGIYRRTLYPGIKRGQIALIMSCGFPDLANFKTEINRFKEITLHSSREFMGAVLRPTGEIFKILSILANFPNIPTLDSLNETLPKTAQVNFIKLLQDLSWKELVQFGKMLMPILPEFIRAQKRGINDILDAAREAGKQLIRDGSMKPETLSIISRDLMPPNISIELIKIGFLIRQRAMQVKAMQIKKSHSN